MNSKMWVYLLGKFCRSTMLARDDSAPPRECPVVTIEYPGYSFNSTVIVIITCAETEFQLQ